MWILLNVTPSTLQEKPAAVYVLTGAMTQSAACALSGAPNKPTAAVPARTNFSHVTFSADFCTPRYGDGNSLQI